MGSFYPLSSRPDLGLPVPSPSGNAVSGKRAADSTELPQNPKLRRSAQEFEAILINSWWRSMKDSFSSLSGSEDEPAHETLDDWSMQAMSSAIAASGGLGLSTLLIRHLGAPSAPNQNPGNPEDKQVPHPHDH